MLIFVNMGITGLIPFIEKASRRTDVSEFSGCTVAIDSYCWLHKGAFACADKLVRGEETDMHIKYCLKYVTMLLSKNIKPILVFDGRHLPAKAMTESKRRESRNISKKRAAELLSLGKIEEARSYLRRSVDITHAMALDLIKECRKMNVDCIVAPYEADAQLAYLNIKNIAQLVITEDSDLILFGCTKVLFKMDLHGTGTLVETSKLPHVMKCPIQHYTFDKFRRMCIMSGCDYLASLPGIGLAKSRQFVVATQDPNFANALRKLPNFFNRMSLIVTDEYRENFLKAEATFKHQYVYDPIERKMLRLTEPDDEDTEKALCVNAGDLLEADTAFQLALGNLDPFTLKKMDDWHPDFRKAVQYPQNNCWIEREVSAHPSIWSPTFVSYLNSTRPWQKPAKAEPLFAIQTTARRKIVNLVSKHVPETQDESLSIQALSSMYCVEPTTKRQKTDDDIEIITSVANEHDAPSDIENKDKSPILENRERSYKKCLRNNNVLRKFSRFPRTVLDENVVESRFFTANAKVEDNGDDRTGSTRNPFKIRSPEANKVTVRSDNQLISDRIPSPILDPVSLKLETLADSPPTLEVNTEDSVIENTYPYETLVTPVDSQESFGESASVVSSQDSGVVLDVTRTNRPTGTKRPGCRVPGLKKATSVPNNQPTLLSKFGFQKKVALKR